MKIVLSCIVLLFGLSAAVAQSDNSFKSKKEALLALRNRVYNSSEAVDFLQKLYWRGDGSTLRPLLDAAEHSDGELAEILGTFYDDVLDRRTETFLRAVARLSYRRQRSLAFHTAVADGGGMNLDQCHRVRIRLNKVIARKDRLARTARMLLTELRSRNPHC